MSWKSDSDMPHSTDDLRIANLKPLIPPALLMEELPVENGRPTQLSLAEVKLPTISDIPALETVLLESDVGTGPYNGRAIGEAPLLGVAPAIANAIRDATGVRMHSLPVTAEKVFHALRAGASSA